MGAVLFISWCIGVMLWIHYAKNNFWPVAVFIATFVIFNDEGEGSDPCDMGL